MRKHAMKSYFKCNALDNMAISPPEMKFHANIILLKLIETNERVTLISRMNNNYKLVQSDKK